jgi:hypothetical protein
MGSSTGWDGGSPTERIDERSQPKALLAFTAPSAVEGTHSSRDCVPGAWCEPGLLLSVGLGSCQAEAAQGEPCDYRCQSGLTCCGTGTKTCVPYAKDGDPCSSDTDCENVNSFCNPESGRCRPRLPVGAACTISNGSAGVNAGCVYYAECVAGNCAQLPSNGQPCSALDGGSPFPFRSCNAGTCTDGICQPSSPCTLKTVLAAEGR